MSMTINKELPNPAALKAEFHPGGHQRNQNRAIKRLPPPFAESPINFSSSSAPCSADNEESVCEYTRRLARVNEQVKRPPHPHSTHLHQ